LLVRADHWETACFTLNRWWLVARHHHRTRRIHGGQADIAFEFRFPWGSQIHDIECARIRLCVPDLDARVTDDEVVSDLRVARTGGYVQTVGVPCDGVLFDLVVVAAINHADAEVIRRIGIAISVSLIQPDPAVLAVESYAATGRPRGGGAVSHDGIAFHERVERGRHDSNPGRAVGGGGKALNARVSRAALTTTPPADDSRHGLLVPWIGDF